VNKPLIVEIRHHTGFDYAEPVATSYNEARMTPVSEASQLVRRSKLQVTPSVNHGRYVDYFGTEVISFEITEPHRRLVVEANSLVERRPIAVGEEISLSALTGPLVQERYVEYLTATPRSSLHQESLEAVFHGAPNEVHALAEHVAEFVRGSMSYLPGATSVSSTAQEAWDAKAGVCQDMTHVMVAMLREFGVPARYVSGYLYPTTSIEPDVAIAGESHAWVEYLSSTWCGIDPTNGLRETERHIIVARGRDYDDVPPLKGVYDGTGSTQLGVEVEMTVRSV
jgi:transglutaminase-like putative cysteine protease